MNESIPDFQKGDGFSASRFNASLPTVRSVRVITGTGGVQVSQTPGGTSISGSVTPQPYLEHYLCKLTATGPNGEADYTDARYFAKIQAIVGGNFGDKIVTYDEMAPQTGTSPGSGGSSTAYPTTITVTNLPEKLADTHTLAVSSSPSVHVWALFDQGDPGGQYGPTVRYVMSESGKPQYPMIPVTVSQSGGSNGTSSTACTYTYNCTETVSGNSISGGPYSVIWARSSNGAVTAGTHGLGYYDSANPAVFHLWQVDEVFTSFACA